MDVFLGIPERGRRGECVARAHVWRELDRMRLGGRRRARGRGDVRADREEAEGGMIRRMGGGGGNRRGPDGRRGAGREELYGTQCRAQSWFQGKTDVVLTAGRFRGGCERILREPGKTVGSRRARPTGGAMARQMRHIRTAYRAHLWPHQHRRHTMWRTQRGRRSL